jgi:dephospho-CoA kinase
MVKIGLCGIMASGKTTLAEQLIQNYSDFTRVSLANAVKEFANFIFDIPEGYKDRVAYQKMGDGARNYLFQDVWIETLLQQVAEQEGFNKHFVVDDIRYENEVDKLKGKGWYIVKLDIDEDLQLERLKATYPDNWEVHAEARSHASESQVNNIPLEKFDFIIKASNDESPLAQLDNFVNEIYQKERAFLAEKRLTIVDFNF